MPEEKVEYKPTCPYCGRSDCSVVTEQEQKQEPELVCPLRMHAWDNSHKSIKADGGLMGVQESIKCLKEKCAWWMESLQMCSIQAIPDCIGGLMEFAEEQS